MEAVNERQFNNYYVYRVWYWCERDSREAFFTNKEDAQHFAYEVHGVVNKWSWFMQIEK